MRNDVHKDKQKNGMDRCDDHKQSGHHGAKTFRRGRALEFLERMCVKRTTLKQQLVASEFQPIHSIILGELKAIETVIDEFSKLFELHESEVMEKEKIMANEDLSLHNHEEME